MPPLINAAVPVFEPGQDDRQAGPSLLNRATPLAPPPTAADAADWHRQNLADTWEAVKDPQTWQDAADAYGNALLMGSVAPEMKALRAMTPGAEGIDPIIGRFPGTNRPMLASEAADLRARAQDMTPDPLSSRNFYSIKPPEMPPRPFAADYPAEVPADGSGTLTHTMDGQPVTARYVVGRRTVSGPDVAITPEESVKVSTGLLGAAPTPVAGKSIAGDAGRLSPAADPVTGDPAFKLVFNKSLKPGVRDDTIAHEVGHGIDYLAKTIDQTGIKTELANVYHDLNSPQSKSAGLTTPQNLFGYTDQQAPKELMAEAIRAYMQNPNYLKTVAPQTAERIRAAVNGNDMFKRWIQFNSAALVAGGGAAAGLPNSQDQP